MGMDSLSVTELESHRISTEVLYRTLLLADAAQDTVGCPVPSAMFDLQFRDVLQISAEGGAAEGLGYIPGALSALWEGALRVRLAASSALGPYF